MAVPITCLACNASYSVDDSKRGKKVYCRECKTPVAVPGGEGAVQSRPKKTGADQSGERPSLQTDTGEQRSGTSVMLIVGGVVVLFVAFGVGLVSLIAILIKQSQAGPPIEQPPELITKNDGKKKDADNPIENPIKPKTTPEPKPKPRSDSKPEVKPEPKPASELPKEITPQASTRAKQTTVYLRVKLSNGEISEGSGFFALERGIVVTNAQVLGMKAPSSRPPESVEVVVHSGEAGELKTAGLVLGVDRASDLAVLRVNLTAPPAPLELEVDAKVFQAQKVYVLGTPEASQPGKSITMNPTSVSELLTDISGAVDRIQVAEGMHVGTSGGPLVNTAGRLVGVCIASPDGVKKPYAIPADRVRYLIEGRFAESKLGEAYTQFGQAHMPVYYVCLDPLNRVRELKVEVWAGPPGKTRPDSFRKPQAVLGDGPRQTYPVTYQNGVGTLDVPLPTLGPDQVYWFQPVLTNARGDAYWGMALATQNPLVLLDRKFADLQVKFDANKERTITVKSQSKVTLLQGKEKKNSSEMLQAKMLESVTTTDKNGAKIRTGYADLKLSGLQDGGPIRINREVALTLKQMPPTFVVEANNKRTQRNDGSLNPKLSMELREEVKEKYTHVCNALESVIIPLPNQITKALETWNAQIPIVLRPGKNTEAVDLDLVCKYEGIRVRNQRSEAVITVTGKVKGRDANAGKVRGEVTGKVGFDLAGGYISDTKLNITADFNDRDSDAPANYAFNIDIDLERQVGNTQNVQLPPLPKTKDDPEVPAVVGGMLLNKGSALTPLDPFNRFRPGRRMKAFPVKLTAGAVYVINMRSGAFDSYLFLLAPNGQVIAQDDDGGGFPHARIVYPIRTSGVYTILATSYSSNSFGPFQITVHTDGAAPGFPKKGFGGIGGLK